MDLKKCRTCFIDLDANDLFLKLDQVYKNSKLSLGEKLKLCVPQMDLKHLHNLYICMQCSMHLETAYTFHMTCLKTEQTFHNIRDSEKSHKDCTKQEEKKDSDNMHCYTCNINFSSRNIYNLHMKVMHCINENTSKKDNDRLSISKPKEINDTKFEKFEKADIAKKNKSTRTLRDKKKSKILEDNKESENIRSLVQMVVLQTNLEAPLMTENKRKIRNSQNKQIKMKQNIEKLKESRTIANAIRMNRNTQKVVNIKSQLSKFKVNTQVKKNNEKDILSSKPDIALFKCKFCSKRLASPGALASHTIFVHKEKCNHCNICNRYFIDVDKHKKLHGCHLKPLPAKKTVHLPVRRKWNNSKTKQLKPAKYCLSQNGKYYYIDSGGGRRTCIVCKRRFPSSSTLASHIESSHNGGISCAKCNIRFSANNYSIHVVLGCKRSPFFNYTTDGECICPICNSLWTKDTTLYKHLATHYPTEKLICNVCRKTFDTFILFSKHIASACRNVKIEQGNDGTVFVGVEQGSDKLILKQKSLAHDPLATEPSEKEKKIATSNTHDNQSDYMNSLCNTTTDTVFDKDVKVEPTELYDQTSLMTSENSTSSDQHVGETEFDIPIFPDEDIIMDSPDLVYLMSEDKIIN